MVDKFQLSKRKDRAIRNTINEFLDFHKEQYETRVEAASETRKAVSETKHKWLSSEIHRAERKDGVA